ncbi:MAG: biotin--[acetyl-CoA-carboxylase] ligase [Candidatus Eisenbacteria bacterium]|nr:biotin--[acetyl-CoA-carboxylase] ligase [Candidatus Eisenbacteria bacterium]MCC7140642.1 biotin--[acetyl-CoA-carboxylase] ligase [Candidatus Eisenbacteria bacterium]
MKNLLNLPEAPRASVGSTQDELRLLAQAGAPEGTVVWAAEQTAGRGRGAHSWHSAPGLGLWVSLLLRPRVEVRRWPGLTPLFAVAASWAIESVAPTGWRAAIKWPNDLFGSRGKLGGILAETAAGGLIIGFGLDVAHEENDFPVELRGTASSLRLEGFAPLPTPAELADRLNQHLTVAYERYQNGDRAFLASELRSRFFLHRKQVRLLPTEGSEPLEGVACDVGEQGELILETPSGLQSVWAGEVIGWEAKETD